MEDLSMLRRPLFRVAVRTLWEQAMSHRKTSLQDQIEELAEEEAYWRGRAQRAEASARQAIVRANHLQESLESALAGMDAFQAKIIELQEMIVEQREDSEKLQKLVFNSQALLGHALGVVEDA